MFSSRSNKNFHFVFRSKEDHAIVVVVVVKVVVVVVSTDRKAPTPLNWDQHALLFIQSLICFKMAVNFIKILRI